MTTIVATPDAMFADSFCASYPSFKTDKIHLVQDRQNPDIHWLVGGAGDANVVAFLRNLIGNHGLDNMWKLHLKDYWPPRILKADETDMVIVDMDGGIWTMDSACIPLKVNEQYHAIGSGAELALAAMDRGDDPVGAITFAMERDPYTKGPVDMVMFDG